MRKGVQDNINSWFHLNKLLKHAKQGWLAINMYGIAKHQIQDNDNSGKKEK